MAEAETPTEIVLKMQSEGKGDAEIIAALTEEGLKPAQISEALNQAKIKQAVEAKAAEKAKVAAKEAKAKAKEAGEEGLAPSILTTKKEAPTETESEEVPKPSKEAEAGRMERVAKGAPPEEYTYEYAEGEAAPAVAVDTEAIEEIAEEIVNEKWEEAKAKISSVVEWKEFTESRLKSMDEKMHRIESALDRMQAALLGEVKKYGQSVKSLGTEMRSLEGAFSKILSPLATNIKELQKITGKLKPKGKNKEGKQQQGKQNAQGMPKTKKKNK